MTASQHPAPVGKLAGIRVLDLSMFLPGPFLSLMMADHGAEVIRVEPPGEGEPTREVGLRHPDGMSVWFRNTHRGKRSIQLNLKDPAARDLLLRLADQADVLVEGFRPGVAERLGFDYATVAARNPAIVYCSISAFGQDGPMAGHPAHDLAVQALAGTLALNLDRDGNPAQPGLPAADIAASLHALAGVLMALLAAKATGTGDHVDVAMYDSALAWTVHCAGPGLVEGRPNRVGEERWWGGNAMYRPYRCADGLWLVIGGSEIKFAEALFGALGRPDLVDLCRQGPGPHQAPAIAFLSETFASRPRADWPAVLDRLDICWAPVLTLDQAYRAEQTLLREMVVPDDQGRPQIGTPLKFRAGNPALRTAAPERGADGAALARAVGLSEAEITALAARGAL